jgi:hypothetical protein
MNKRDMTFDEWVKEYKPIGGSNPSDYASSRDIDPDCVWTRFVCDGEMWIESGAGWVNSDCYHVTEIPFSMRGITVEPEPGYARLFSMPYDD